MRFGSKTIIDRSGRSIDLRDPVISDADALIEYMRITAGQTRYLLREPDEVCFTTEQEESFIRHILGSENSMMIVAVSGGKLIGSCSFMPVGAFRRSAHRCDISIALYHEYCGVGIGKQMLEALLCEAKKAGFEQAELEVISENKGAVALYERLGFVKYGSFPDWSKYPDGSYASADWMMKKLCAD